MSGCSPELPEGFWPYHWPTCLRDDLFACGLLHVEVASMEDIGQARRLRGVLGWPARFHDAQVGALLLAPEMDVPRIAHEVGHAVVWSSEGRPSLHDFGSCGSANEARATRAGLAYAELRGLHIPAGHHYGGETDDEARRLVLAVLG